MPSYDHLFAVFNTLNQMQSSYCSQILVYHLMQATNILAFIVTKEMPRNCLIQNIYNNKKNNKFASLLT